MITAICGITPEQSVFKEKMSAIASASTPWMRRFAGVKEGR